MWKEWPTCENGVEMAMQAEETMKNPSVEVPRRVGMRGEEWSGEIEARKHP
jgi:hypothetical protein